MANIVAIVGRPNVGKSTLFNRLTESQKAIVDETAGVTRDRHYGRSEWNGHDFMVIDTGGYVSDNEDVFNKEIRKQVAIALDECSVILFLVDVNTGITDLDSDVAKLLRKSKKKVFVVANKVDNTALVPAAAEFYNFGMDEVYCLSSSNGSGSGELLDDVVKCFEEVELEDTEGIPKISVVGRPNVGKSSVVNVFLNQDRNIVTDISGTTRDSLDTRYKAFGHDFILVDTAGIRRKNKIKDLEFYSVLRTYKAIEESDVCMLMLDATLGIEAQDLNILTLILKARKGLIIMVNKWDLVENKHSNTVTEYEEKIRERIAPFTDVPIVFTSAVDKQRILKSLEMALDVHEKRISKISTSKLNEILLPIIEAVPPPSHRNNYIRIKYITQVPTHTPAFAFYCNHPEHVKEHYKRFLENKIREHFDFAGVPIGIFMRKK